MQNQLFRIKSSHPTLPRLVFLSRTSPTHSKNVLNLIKLRFDFRLKKVWPWSHRKEKGRNHKLPLSRHFLKFKMSCLVKVFTQNLPPLFNRFSTFDKNVNLSKANPEAEKFFLVFLSLNTSIFMTHLKIASTLRPFRKAWLKSKLPKWKSFQTFSITANEIFHPIATGKEIIWSQKLIQTF
jgi:hypothetical protein